MTTWVAALTSADSHDLLQVLENRTERASTLITSQVPVKAWHELTGQPTIADCLEGEPCARRGPST